MYITVVFATYNGSKVLKKTLDSYLEINSPKCGWRLIIVDNNSSDNSCEIVSNYLDKIPIVLLRQPRRGKNVCLNLALSYVSDGLVVFTDDDVLPNNDWLVLYEKLATSHPEASYFGGRILPLWPSLPPTRIVESIPLGPAYGLHPDGIIDGPVSFNMIWGGNMAVRSHVFNHGFRFNESIGPSTGSYAMGSETEFTKRLKDSGHENFFLNSNYVYHQILPEQLSFYWILQRAKKYGRGQSKRTEKYNEFLIFNFFPGFPRWEFKKLSIDFFKLLKSFFGFDVKSVYMYSWEIVVRYYKFYDRFY